MIGKGGDTTISSPGRSPKHLLPGIGRYDPLHGRQACPEFIAFDQGVGQICPRLGLFSCSFLPKRGENYYIPSRPNRSTVGASMVTYQGSTRSELPWRLLALCRHTLGSERHRYVIIVVVVVVSHIQRIGCQPEKNYQVLYTVAWSAEQGKKEKVRQRPPPPPPPALFVVDRRTKKKITRHIHMYV